MGLVQRDGINRLRNVMRYSRQKMTICTSLPEAGWQAGVGASRGVDPREMAKSDLIVVWGGNPVSTQVNVMTHVSRARKERGAKLVVVDPYKTPTAAVADLHLAPRPGTDAALACAVMHIAFRDGYADRALHARLRRLPGRAGGASAHAWPGMGVGGHRYPGRIDRSFRGAVRTDQAQLHPLRLRLRSQPQRRRGDACRGLPADRHRRLAARRRRRAVVEPRDVSLGQDADRGAGRASTPPSAFWT